MIDETKLIDEFNRLKSELIANNEGTMFEQGRISAFEDVLLYINSLQKGYKLTLQDIKKVITVEHDAIADDRRHHKLMTQEDLYKEILKRINDEQTS